MSPYLRHLALCLAHRRCPLTPLERPKLHWKPISRSQLYFQFIELKKHMHIVNWKINVSAASRRSSSDHVLWTREKGSQRYFQIHVASQGGRWLAPGFFHVWAELAHPGEPLASSSAIHVTTAEGSSARPHWEAGMWFHLVPAAVSSKSPWASCSQNFYVLSSVFYGNTLPKTRWDRSVHWNVGDKLLNWLQRRGPSSYTAWGGRIPPAH